MACVTTTGWSTILHRIFLLSPSNQRISKRPNPRLTLHPAGELWKSALARFIFSDLTLGIYECRRFVRLEYPGLSGVLVYELPKKGELVLKEVFGDETDENDLGMDVDELLDRVAVKLTHSPAYACTSFVTGQVMNALLYSRDMRPISTQHGFLVPSKAFYLFNSPPSSNPESYKRKPVMDVLSLLRSSKQTYSGTDFRFIDLPSSDLEQQDDYLQAACVDSVLQELDFDLDSEFVNLPAYLVDGDPDCFDEIMEDEVEDDRSDSDKDVDTSVSTIDSLGPSTPPRNIQSDLKTCFSPALVDLNSAFQDSMPVSSSLADIPSSLSSLGRIDYILTDAINFFNLPEECGVKMDVDRDILPTQGDSKDKENFVIKKDTRDSLVWSGSF